MARKLLLTFLLISASACTGDDDDDTSILKDTGVTPDSGMNNPDGGTNPDGGMGDTGVGQCNLQDGTGCQGGQFCVFVAQNNEAQCRDLPAAGMRIAHEGTCDPVMHDCEVGHACIDFGPGPQCYKTCDAAVATSCDAVVGAAPDYICGQFQANGQPSLTGVCQGNTTCNPAEKAAACGAMETCNLVSATETGCIPQGTAMAGAVCGGANGACVSGLTCVDIGEGPTCYEGCDNMTNPCTSGTANCTPLGGFNWGICREAGMACDPFTMPCAGGMTCSLLFGSAECETSGAAAVGQTCGANMQCVDAAVCAFLQGDNMPTCREPCDTNNPQCTSGTCNGLQGVSFGLCLP